MLPLCLAKYNMWQKWQTDYRLYIIILKINQTVKLVKLFEKMFNMSSVVLDKRLLFPFINAVVDESLSQRVSDS